MNKQVKILFSSGEAKSARQKGDRYQQDQLPDNSIIMIYHIYDSFS